MALVRCPMALARCLMASAWLPVMAARQALILTALPGLATRCGTGRCRRRGQVIS